MNEPLIISGAPGAGKTTLASALARSDVMGVHLATDFFFAAVPHALDPSKPGSQAQNEAIVRAYCSAAREYGNAGYRVYVDGVIGPWWFPVLFGFFESFDYVLLTIPSDRARSRIDQRQGVQPVRRSVADRMISQFEKVAADLPGHCVPAGTADVAALGETIRSGRAAGRFTVRRGTAGGVRSG